METTRWERKVILPVLAGALLVPGSIVPVQAAEEDESTQSFMPSAGIESVLEESYETDVKDNIDLYLVPNEEGEYFNMAFSDTGEESFTYIRSAPDEESGWTGKLYEDSAVEVMEYLDGWTRIRSGEAEGYVPADTLITGKSAADCADEYLQETASVTAYTLNVRDGQGTDASVLTQIHKGEEYKVTGEPVEGWYPLSVGEIDGWVSGKYITTETAYSYGETKEQEEQRIAEEEARKKQAERDAREREAAQKEAEELPDVAVTVNLDLGEKNDLHPTGKREVAYRMYRAALQTVYKEEVPCSGPVPVQIRMSAGTGAETGTEKCETLRVQISFRLDPWEREKFLVTQDGMAPGEFELAGEDGVWHPAQAAIQGLEVELKCSEVQRPVQVRYGWRTRRTGGCCAVLADFLLLRLQKR